MTIAAIYCRVSTDNQEREGTSLETQLQACLDYCQHKGYEAAYRFTETFSGLDLYRPKLKELRELVRAGKVSAIVVYCLDRLSRDPTHGVILMQELERFNVTLEAVTETVDSTELGKLISYIRGFASKLEAEKIRERTMRGKTAHVNNGRLPQGTGIGIYGYNWDKTTGRRIILDREAKVVRRIFAMRISGASTNQIAVTLNKEHIPSKSGSHWHPLTVRRILNNPAYTGKTYFGQTKRVGRTKVARQPKETWILLPHITPPIITEEIFNKAQIVSFRAKEVRPLRPNSPYLLSGFIKCSKCGSTIGGTMIGGKYRYYQCRGARPTSTRGKVCDAGYIKADEIERFVWERLVKLWSSPLTIVSLFTNFGYDSSRNNILPMLDRQITQLKKTLATYPARERNLYSLLSDDSVTRNFVLDEIGKLKQRQKEDELQLQQLLEQRKQSNQYLELPYKLTEHSDVFRNGSESLSFEQKRTILRLLDVRVQAVPGAYRFTCFIDAELKSEDYNEKLETGFTDKVKDFEAKHPDLTFLDLIDHAKRVPDDTVFGRASNQVREYRKSRTDADLVTTGQTSA